MLKFISVSGFALLLFLTDSFAQERIYWSPDYQLGINDFASPKTKDCKPPKKKKLANSSVD